MEILLFILLLLLSHAVFDPSLVAYRDMRRIKKSLGIKRKALKPLLKLALSQNDKAVTRSASRVIKVVIVQDFVILVLLLLMFERCYIDFSWLGGLKCEKPTQYSYYLLFVWLGFMALMLYVLWEMLKLHKQARRQLIK